MGLVDVKDYYLASRLDQIKHWFNPVKRPPRVANEENLLKSPDLRSLLLADIWQPIQLKDISPPVRASLLAWRALHITQCPESFDTSLHIPIDALHYIILHISLEPWMLKGVQVLDDITIKGKLQDWEGLQKRFGLSSTDHYTYCRLQHLIQNSPAPNIQLPKLLLNFYLSTPPKSKGISLIYNSLQ